MMEKILARSEFSGRAVALIHQIKSAGRDGNQMPAQIGAILSSLGYAKTTDGKHTKYTPSDEMFGLNVEMVPKTPSDGMRGGKNKATDLIKSFGLQKLK